MIAILLLCQLVRDDRLRPVRDACSVPCILSRIIVADRQKIRVQQARVKRDLPGERYGTSFPVSGEKTVVLTVPWDPL